MMEKLYVLRIVLSVLCSVLVVYNLFWHANRMILPWERFKKDLSLGEFLATVLFVATIGIYGDSPITEKPALAIVCTAFGIVVLGHLPILWHGAKDPRIPKIDAIGWIIGPFWTQKFYNGSRIIPCVPLLDNRWGRLWFVCFHSGYRAYHVQSLAGNNGQRVLAYLTFTARECCTPVMFEDRVADMMEAARSIMDANVNKSIARIRSVLYDSMRPGDREWVDAVILDVSIES